MNYERLVLKLPVTGNLPHRILVCFTLLSLLTMGTTFAGPHRTLQGSAEAQYKERSLQAREQLRAYHQRLSALDKQPSAGKQAGVSPAVGISINSSEKTSSTLFFSDNMEGGANGWTTEAYSGADIWHQTTLGAASPTHSWWAGVDLLFNYNTGSRVNAALKSPPINLAGATGSIKLVFAENYVTETGWDYCMVDVTTDGGTTWTPLRGGYGVAPTGDTQGWIISSIDLTAYGGKTINIRFYFDTGDSNFNDFPGWFLDDVAIFDQGGIVMGRKFFDVNGNGVKDIGDRGVKDWLITVSGPVTMTMRTNIRGHYEVPVPQGSYTITETSQFPWTQTYPPGDQWSVSVATPDTVIDSLWFGNYTQASFINGMKFDDVNRSGSKDGGDTALANWKIILSDTLGNQVDFDWTDSLGQYQLHVLEPGRYVVHEIVKKGWVQSFPSTESYTVDILNLTTTLNDYDFGNYHTDSVNSILGQKFNDRNRNGLKDPDEVGVPGFTMKLTGPKNKTVATDSGGYYQFLNLPPGTYKVKEIAQEGWWQSFPESSYTVTLNGSDFVDSVDFGNYPILPGSISGTKFHDANGNGVRDDAESGLAGWHILLNGTNYVSASVNLSTVSDGSGNFSFNGLWPGTYTVSEVWKSGWTQTNPAGLAPHFIPLSLEENRAGVDFGNYDSLFIGSFRTFVPESLALDIDKKGKHKPVPLVPDKDEFHLTVYNPASDSAHILRIIFAYAATDSEITLSRPGTVELIDLKPNKFKVTFDSYVQGHDSVTVSGMISKAKAQKVSQYRWVYNDSTGRAKTYFTGTNYLRLPMPNAINLVQLVGAGSRVGLGGPHSVVHPTYTYVMKSLVERLDRMHLTTSVARCLSYYAGTKTSIRRQINFLSPTRGNNKLFAEALALKLNIAGSDKMILPPGFGNLVFDEGTGAANPMNGLTIREIAARVDSFMSSFKDTGLVHECRMPPTWPGFSPESLYVKIRKINSVFSGTVDTVSFSGVLKFTPVLPLSAADFLRYDAEAAARTVIGPAGSVFSQPERFALHQNFPNPFNPATTLSFVLSRPSFVTLKVYNILGQEVATLLNRESMDEGWQEVVFDGSSLSSGVYFYHLQAVGVADDEGAPVQTYTAVRKMLLMK